MKGKKPKSINEHFNNKYAIAKNLLVCDGSILHFSKLVVSLAAKFDSNGKKFPGRNTPPGKHAFDIMYCPTADQDLKG